MTIIPDNTDEKDYSIPWLSSHGSLMVSDKSIHIRIGLDFIRYYKWLIDRRIRTITNEPAHGAHITLWNQNHHGVIPRDKTDQLMRFYNKTRIKFDYYPYIFVGGYTKGFYNFYMNVVSPEIDSINRTLHGRVKNSLHITISNTKGGSRPYIF